MDLTIEAIKAGPHKHIVVRDLVHHGSQAAHAMLDHLWPEDTQNTVVCDRPEG